MQFSRQFLFLFLFFLLRSFSRKGTIQISNEIALPAVVSPVSLRHGLIARVAVEEGAAVDVSLGGGVVELESVLVRLALDRFGQEGALHVHPVVAFVALEAEGADEVAAGVAAVVEAVLRRLGEEGEGVVRVGLVAQLLWQLGARLVEDEVAAALRAGEGRGPGEVLLADGAGLLAGILRGGEF